VKLVRTYSAAIRSPGDDVVLKFKVRVEDGGVELRLAVELVADALPIGRWFRHRVRYSSLSWGGHHLGMDAEVVAEVKMDEMAQSSQRGSRGGPVPKASEG
jgi:hypothetical protein